MSLQVKLVGGKGKNSTVSEVHVHPFDSTGGIHHGLVVLSERFLQFNPTIKPFLNDTFGTQMNQNISFGTTGNILHDGGSSASVDTGNADTNTPDFLEDTGASWGVGGDAGLVQVGMTVEETAGSDYARISTVTGTKLGLTTIASKGATAFDMFEAGTEAYIINAVWTGTATIGTWDFSTSNVITQAAGNNGDQADIEANADDQSLASDFTALTGSVNLNTYSDVNHSITVQMTLAGATVGNSINLNDFIDTGDFDAQQFSIPIADLVGTDQLMNGIRIIVGRTGGSKPAFTLDDVRLEVAGTPAAFKVTTPVGSRFHVNEIRIRIEDALTTVLTDASMPNIDPNAILGVPALTNGIAFARTQNNRIEFSVLLKDLGDFFSTGSNSINVFGNGTNQGLTLLVEFPDPIVLVGSVGDFLSFTVNDDLSNLTRFTAVARGAIEV